MSDFAWRLPGGRLSFAGEVEDYGRIEKAVRNLLGDPAGLEKSLCQALQSTRRRNSRAAVEQLLYLVLCRPRGAQALVDYEPTEEEVDNPPSLLDRCRRVVEQWENLDERQRGREYLLLHLHQLLKLSEADPDRDAKLRFLLSLLPQYPT